MSLYGQQFGRVNFNYDTAGNQSQRILCVNCNNGRYSDQEYDVIVENEMMKFSADDTFSFYPNPVKEELHIKWNLTDGKNVSEIGVYSLNGQLIKVFNKLENCQTKNIPFLDYPQGTYLIVLNFTNGKQKSITILKK